MPIASSGRIEAGQPLVEQQQLRLRGEGAGELQPLLVDIGQARGRQVRTHPASPTRSSSAAARASASAPQSGAACERRAPASTFSRQAHAVEHADELERAGDAEPGDAIRRKAGDVAACEPDARRVRPQKRRTSD